MGSLQERLIKNSTTGAIALHFSEADTPRGWQKLDQLGISLHITKDAYGLCYIFSAGHWPRVEEALQKDKIPYLYQQAASFSKHSLTDP